MIFGCDSGHGMIPGSAAGNDGHLQPAQLLNNVFQPDKTGIRGIPSEHRAQGCQSSF